MFYTNTRSPVKSDLPARSVGVVFHPRMAAIRPKHLVLIDASNHRFTDRLPELKQQVIAGLAWIGATRQGS